MAKYIKTEEGYKLFKEIEDNQLLSADNFIEINNNVVCSTFGKSASVEINDSIEFYSSGTIPTLSSSGSLWSYNSSDGPTPFLLPLAYGSSSIVVEIITPTNDILIFEGISINTSPSSGIYNCYISELNLISPTTSTVKFQYSFYSAIGTSYRIASSEDLSGSKVNIYKINKETVQNFVKLPKNALYYDTVPTAGSTNLLTSGSIYTALEDVKSNIEDVQNNIKSDIENGITTEYIRSSCTFGDTTVMAEGSITVKSPSEADTSYTGVDWTDLEIGATYIIKIGATEYTGVCKAYDNIYVGNMGLSEYSSFYEDTGEPFVLYVYSIGPYTYTKLVVSTQIGEGTYPYSIIKDERETVYKSMSPFDLIKQIEDLNNTVEALTAKIEALKENQITAVTNNEVPSNSPEGAE